MKAAIIGAGRMGGWFASYFHKRGYEIKVFDKKPSVAFKLAKEIGASIGKSIKDTVYDADVTIVAVSLDAMASAVTDVLKHAKHGSVIVEVSSIKAHVVTAVKKSRYMHAKLLSVHPLFGPGASDMKGKIIALIPIRSTRSELRVAKSLFSDANFVVVDWRTHDKIMAHVLFLSHLLAISLVFSIDRWMFRKAKKLSGTTFKLQMLSAATSLSESPELIVSTFGLNPYTLRTFSSYMKKLNELVKHIKRGDVDRLEKIFRTCRAKIGERLYEEAYALLERRHLS